MQVCRGGGVEGGSSPFVKIMRDFGGISPLHQTYFTLGSCFAASNIFYNVLKYALAKGERKGTLLPIEKECFNPMLTFPSSFHSSILKDPLGLVFFKVYYFHIHSSSKQNVAIHSKLGAVKDVVHILSTSQLLCYSFRMALLRKWLSSRYYLATLKCKT